MTRSNANGRFDTLIQALSMIALCFWTVGQAFAGTAFNKLTSDEQRVLAPYQQEWNRLDNATQERLRLGAKRWLALSPEQRAKAAARWQSMSEEERALARQRMQRFRELPPQQRRRILRAYRQFRDLPPAERQRLQRNFDRLRPAGNPGGRAQGFLAHLPEPERRATIAMLQSLSPAEKRALRRKMEILLPAEREAVRVKLLAMSANQRRNYLLGE